MSEKTFDIAYLSDNLLELWSDIQNNMEITLTCQGVPWAKVLPISSENLTVEKVGLNQNKKEGVLEPRIAGFWQGQVKIADDFDDISEEVIAAFYGEE